MTKTSAVPDFSGCQSCLCDAVVKLNPVCRVRMIPHLSTVGAVVSCCVVSCCVAEHRCIGIIRPPFCCSNAEAKAANSLSEIITQLLTRLMIWKGLLSLLLMFEGKRQRKSRLSHRSSLKQYLDFHVLPINRHIDK